VTASFGIGAIKLNGGGVAQRFENIWNRVRDIVFHKNARTAERSISLRSGRRLSRVVTSTSTPVHPTADAPVNPCKGGRANWKTAKKTRKIGNSAENNRAEQEKTANPRPGSACRRLPLLKLDTFLSAGNDALFHDKKPGAVTRPGICVTLNYICFYRNHVTLSSKS
jgi:hypothetical protein